VRDRWFGSWKTAYLFFAIALLVSVCFKLSQLGSRELWLDETYSAFTSHLRFRELLHATFGDVHPPLFPILLWGWVRIAGDTQAMLRLFSVLWNLGAMVAVFFLARRALGALFGSFAAILFALSPMLFVYSLEVRNYMLFLFLLSCLLLVHWKVAVERSPSRALIVLYGLLAAALFFTHYLGIFLVFGLFVHWGIVSIHSRDQWPGPASPVC